MQNNNSIYQSDVAPLWFIEGFNWWAATEADNQKYFPCPKCKCDMRVFLPKDISLECLEKIVQECNRFWELARHLIKSSKGRCNWHPDSDTDECHVRNCGQNFYTVRNGSEFFLESWPEYERREFCRIANEFLPLKLIQVEGKLEYPNNARS